MNYWTHFVVNFVTIDVAALSNSCKQMMRISRRPLFVWCILRFFFFSKCFRSFQGYVESRLILLWKHCDLRLCALSTFLWFRKQFNRSFVCCSSRVQHTFEAHSNEKNQCFFIMIHCWSGGLRCVPNEYWFYLNLYTFWWRVIAASTGQSKRQPKTKKPKPKWNYMFIVRSIGHQ